MAPDTHDNAKRRQVVSDLIAQAHRDGAATQIYGGPLGRLVHVITKPIRGRGFYRRSGFVRAVHRQLLRLSGGRVVQVNGFDVEVDELDSLSLTLWPCYEPWETAWYDEIVRPGDLVVEVGANIGVFTLQFAKKTGARGSVIAFEPDPVTARLLSRNLQRNDIHNVDIRVKAASNVTGPASFFRSTQNHGDNRLFAHDDDQARPFDVDTTLLDDELKHVEGTIRLLKMDIQGAEALALEGMKRTLTTNPPEYILMEYWPFGLTGVGSDPLASINILRDGGYQLSELLIDGSLGEVNDVDELLHKYSPASQLWCNLIAYR